MSDSIIQIPVDGVELEGELIVPDGANGIVVFAHGSGSSRKSPRNNYVAEVLRERGLATLLFDLLTEEEDRVRENRFDIPLLTDRLIGVTDWL
ncbi:MAG: alpha/beta hydrolase, partial [Halobacteria archaeon]|nr:alpha/beta hydrolase [Halobacteria archaeon]